MCVFGVVDVKSHYFEVFNPHAPSICSSTPRVVYRCHENTKKQTFEAKICEVQHGTFTAPLVFSVTGGMVDQAIVL